MSIRKISLRKLLTLMFSQPAQTKSLLRTDVRESIPRESGLVSDGGDFHVPFWHDAKAHVNGVRDLHIAVAERIGAHKGRERLYPELRDGFLDWWNNKRRWTNEPSTSEYLAVRGALDLPNLQAVVKIENLLALSIGQSENRIIYPYFSERPVLSADGARLALWAIGSALPKYPLEEFRILDVMRGQSFAPSDVKFSGHEEADFSSRFLALISAWESLSQEYQPA